MSPARSRTILSKHADFPKRLRPSGPWSLVAIYPTPDASRAAGDEDKKIVGHTFRDLKKAAAWITKRDGKANLYFHPATLKSDVHGKAKKSDIAGSDYLHIDIDKDDAGARLTTPEAKQGVIDRLQALKQPGPPSLLWDSGNGIQALWRVESVQDMAFVEAGNRWLAETLGGDKSCWNADRLLRIPGTVNLPDARKRKAGLVPVPSIFIADTGAVYSADEITLAEPKAVAGAEYGAEIGAPEFVESLDALAAEYTLPDYVLRIVEHGHDDETKRPGWSRSEWLMRGVLGMIRARVPDETIMGVLLDTRFGIAESVYGQNRSPEDYAERQIRRAHQYDLAQIAADFEGVEEVVEVRGDEWPEPEPLGEDLLPVEPFDYELLPNAFRGLVRNAATSMQSPPDFPAVAVMIAAGTVIGRQCGIRPKQLDDWKEYPNLWGVVIGTPGVAKTPSMAYGLKPLDLLEADARKEYEVEVAKYLKAKELAELRSKAVSRRIEKIYREAETELPELPELPDIPTAPTMRRYATNSPTVEALAEIMRENPRGVLIIRDELISLLRTLDREDRAEDRGYYLTAWAAKQSYTFDRIVRGNRYIPYVALSIIGSAQPDLIRSYLQEAIAGGGGDGMLARFSLMVWPDIDKNWRYVDCKPDEFARDQADTAFQVLDKLEVGAERDAKGNAYLRFSPDAQAEFRKWLESFEPFLRHNDEHPALVAHLAKYKKAVPALALICALADGEHGAVSAVSLRRALAWAKYLESHARRAYGSVVAGETIAAKLILNRLRNRNLPSPFTQRDLSLKSWAGLTDAKLVADALLLLCEHRWLRRTKRKPETGRPTSDYEAHPSIWSPGAEEF